MLELRHVVKSYQIGSAEPICAVNDVSITVEPGEFLALYGPSGSGKTTLLELIAALKVPDRGAVLFERRDIFSLSRKEQDSYRLRDIGIIGPPQSLIPGARAIENAQLKLLLTNARHARSTIEPLLDELGLMDRLHHRTEQLSMGERQRLLVARALATEPKLVLADEPTGSLDTQRTREVLRVMRRLCGERNTSIILATHDPEAAYVADHALELRDGRLQKLQSDELLPAGPLKDCN